MQFSCFPPTERLRKLVKQYWVLEKMSSGVESQELFPVGSVEMIFHFGDPLHRQEGKECRPESKVFIEGLQSGTIGVKLPDQIRTVGITLYPWATTVLFNAAPAEFTNHRFDASDVNHSLNELYERLAAVRSPTEIVSLCDHHLIYLASLSRWRPVNADLEILDRFKKVAFAESVQALKTDWPYSSKLFEKRFQSMIGMPAGELLKKIRMANALKLLINRNARSLTDIGHASGFYDQSHFIRDYRYYFQRSPKFFVEEQDLLRYFLA